MLKGLHGQTEETKNGKNSQIKSRKVITDSKGNTVSTEINTSDKSGGKLSPSLAEKLDNALHGTNAVDTSAGEALAAEGSGLTAIDRDFVSPEQSKAIRDLNAILDEIATERATNLNSEKVSNELISSIPDVNWGSIHKNANKIVHRSKEVPLYNRTKYSMIAKQVENVVDKMAKCISRAIKSENMTGERNGLIVGDYLDTNNLFRPDMKVWRERKKPQKTIDLAVSMILDESGSMCGAKSEMTRITAILFAEVCEKLHIPLEIFGHSTHGNDVDLFSYLAFDSVDKNDKYRLVDISARGCNRDGAAVIFGCERLCKRPEQKKLFIIISDGRPNHQNYCGDAAKSDLKHIKNTYQKRGVVFAAAAIDSDKEYIKEIYGRNFIDISTLNELPRVLARILQSSALR